MNILNTGHYFGQEIYDGQNGSKRKDETDVEEEKEEKEKEKIIMIINK